MVANQLKRLLGLSVLGLFVGCSSQATLEMKLVDPCNRDVLTSVDFLVITPKGDGIDSNALTTIASVGSRGVDSIVVPPSPNLQLVVTGHQGAFDGPITAIGVSNAIDTTAAEGVVQLRVPLAPANDFYQTTQLRDPTVCTELTFGRVGSTATYAPGIGKVVIVGGRELVNGSEVYRREVEFFDPATGEFSIAGDLIEDHARAFHSATLLEDGRLLIAGGQTNLGGTVHALSSGILLELSSSAVKVVSEPQLSVARSGHRAVRLTDGTVVIAGGESYQNGTAWSYPRVVERFEPATGGFAQPGVLGSTSDLELAYGRFGHSLSLLEEDVLVIAGGLNETGAQATFETFQFTADGVKVFATQAMGLVGAVHHTAQALPGGTVVLAGGYETAADADPVGTLPRLPVPELEAWTLDAFNGELRPSCTSDLVMPRGFAQSVVSSGKVIIMGGRGADGTPLATTELVDVSAGGCSVQIASMRQMREGRVGHAVTSLIDRGEVLVLGGEDQRPTELSARSLASAEIFSPLRIP